MKVVLISGSNRASSQSLRVAQFLQQRAEKLGHFETEVIDLHERPFSVSPDDNFLGTKEPHFQYIHDAIQSADALVLITPEWAGAASPMLRALLIFIGQAASYKPALLVGVSISRGGAYPIMELKASGNKNNFITFLPEHLIFRDVGKMSFSEKPSGEEEQYMWDRSDYALTLLSSFAHFLKEMRGSGVLRLDKYPFGM